MKVFKRISMRVMTFYKMNVSFLCQSHITSNQACSEGHCPALFEGPIHLGETALEDKVAEQRCWCNGDLDRCRHWSVFH